jgi:hypothetical protein
MNHPILTLNLMKKLEFISLDLKSIYLCFKRLMKLEQNYKHIYV